MPISNVVCFFLFVSACWVNVLPKVGYGVDWRDSELMRTSSLVILVFAFVIGWISAKLIGQYAFVTDAPRVVVDDRPRTKILVAKTAIPVGMEILAEHVSYVDVPVSELPSRAIKSFGDVYKRKPAFPIPVNCPLCEDLLIAKNDEHNNEDTKFIPAGYTIVSLDVEFLNKRQTQNINELENAEFGQVLKKGNHVDIRVIAKRIPKGTFATIKEQLLQTYACKFDVGSAGDIVLEDVQIHNLKSYGYDANGNSMQKVSFLLDESKLEQLANAAKKGRLRIVTHHSKTESTTPNETHQTEKAVAATNEYKGFGSYRKVSRNKTTSTVSSSADKNLIANNQPETVEPAAKPEDKKSPPPKKVESTPTPKTTLSTIPTTNDKEKPLLNEIQTKLQTTASEPVAVIPPLWGFPLYLRDLYDSQPSQNINTNRNNNTELVNDSSIIKTENAEQGIASSTTSHNSINNSEPANKKHKPNSAANNSIVFVTPQTTKNASQNIVPISTTGNETHNDETGWSNTGKYMIGSSTTTNVDK
jgi:hypothetical protein